MKPYVNVLFLVFLYANIVWSNKLWESTYSELSFPPWVVHENQCVYTTDIISQFRYALYEFTTQMFKRVAIESGNHFISSPISIWLSLAAIAEGSQGNARKELFHLLNIPEDRCIRQQIYIVATSREYPVNDDTLFRKRFFVIDESISLNRQWKNFVHSNRLTEIIGLPLNRKPEESLDTLRQITSTRLPNIDLNGNSLVLDTVNSKIVWNTAFLGAKVERVPFYNDFGEEIGIINMMKMKKRVKLAFLPDIKLKVLELPVGYNNRYRLMFGIAHGTNSSIKYTIENFKNDMIINIVKKLRLSRIPLDIGIPQYSVTTETDVRKILEKLGVNDLWIDPWATRNISDPPAFPSGFVQRVTLTLDSPAVKTLVEETSNFVPAIGDLKNDDTGLDFEIGRDFIANRPFMLGLVDAETYTCLLTSTFSRPSTK